ncbi:MAG: hypothetical protein V5804_01485 [Mucilaginibacter sp.]|uniref:hypothetical protein n=1 Tax=Mucilaginibacter sp. TaxID=1882438 RepID=UPI0034E4BB6D
METEKSVNEENDFRRGKLEHVGGPISLEKVRLWTSNYRKINDKTITTSHFFGREVIVKLLKQRGCVGIRMHYALDDKGHRQLILSGVDEHGKDQLPNHTNNSLKEDGQPHTIMAEASANGTGEFSFYDQSWPCPGTQGCS